MQWSNNVTEIKSSSPPHCPPFWKATHQRTSLINHELSVVHFSCLQLTPDYIQPLLCLIWYPSRLQSIWWSKRNGGIEPWTKLYMKMAAVLFCASHFFCRMLVGSIFSLNENRKAKSCFTQISVRQMNQQETVCDSYVYSTYRVHQFFSSVGKYNNVFTVNPFAMGVFF